MQSAAASAVTLGLVLFHLNTVRHSATKFGAKVGYMVPLWTNDKFGLHARRHSEGQGSNLAKVAIKCPGQTESRSSFKIGHNVHNASLLGWRNW